MINLDPKSNALSELIPDLARTGVNDGHNCIIIQTGGFERGGANGFYQ
jgi:hypothetical protein